MYHHAVMRLKSVYLDRLCCMSIMKKSLYGIHSLRFLKGIRQDMNTKTAGWERYPGLLFLYFTMLYVLF